MANAGTAAVPRDACDCHTHVFGPAAAYPFAALRNYTPPDALPRELEAFLGRTGFARVVVVQPTAYGDDDRLLLDTLLALGPRARGVTAARELSGDELRARSAVGVTALRLNAADSAADRALAARVAAADALARTAGWHLELQLPATMFLDLVPTLERCTVPLVLDHLGRLAGPADAALGPVVAMLRTGRLWVKLSGADRYPGWPERRADALALMRTLIRANPDRVVWGSDWPHTPFHARAPSRSPPESPFRAVEVSELLALLAEAAGDDAFVARILVRNSAVLYRFSG
jgi:predicted TIM-barrel fold metal-dependent hydrolase